MLFGAIFENPNPTQPVVLTLKLNDILSFWSSNSHRKRNRLLSKDWVNWVDVPMEKQGCKYLIITMSWYLHNICIAWSLYTLGGKCPKSPRLTQMHIFYERYSSIQKSRRKRLMTSLAMLFCLFPKMLFYSWTSPGSGHLGDTDKNIYKIYQ